MIEQQKIKMNRLTEPKPFLYTYTVPVTIMVQIYVQGMWTFHAGDIHLSVNKARPDIFGYGCAAGTLIPLPYTRPCSAAFCDPMLD